jgi:hypothetical protein
MSTFQDNNFLPLILLKYHNAKLKFRYNNNYVPDDDIKFYGKVISLGNRHDMLQTLNKEVFSFSTLATHSYYVNPKIIASNNGINTYQLERTYLNHPVSCIYFWGLDISKIVSIQFKLNSNIYLSTDVKTLRRYYGKTNNPDILVWMIKDNAYSLTEKPRSTINFSRVDYFTIEIQTTEDLDADHKIYYSAITNHKISFSGGMAGLAFSK